MEVSGDRSLQADRRCTPCPRLSEAGQLQTGLDTQNASTRLLLNSALHPWAQRGGALVLLALLLGGALAFESECFA